jgi:hypothetical protein
MCGTWQAEGLICDLLDSNWNSLLPWNVHGSIAASATELISPGKDLFSNTHRTHCNGMQCRVRWVFVWVVMDQWQSRCGFMKVGCLTRFSAEQA